MSLAVFHASLTSTHLLNRLSSLQYSVDYPWATNEEGRAFMDELKSSGMVTVEEWEDIAFRNAEGLLRWG